MTAVARCCPIPTRSPGGGQRLVAVAGAKAGRSGSACRAARPRSSCTGCSPGRSFATASPGGACTGSSATSASGTGRRPAATGAWPRRRSGISSPTATCTRSRPTARRRPAPRPTLRSCRPGTAPTGSPPPGRSSTSCSSASRGRPHRLAVSGQAEAREGEAWVVAVPEAGLAPFVPRVSLTLPALAATPLMLSWSPARASGRRSPGSLPARTCRRTTPGPGARLCGCSTRPRRADG